MAPALSSTYILWLLLTLFPLVATSFLQEHKCFYTVSAKSHPVKLTDSSCVSGLVRAAWRLLSPLVTLHLLHMCERAPIKADMFWCSDRRSVVFDLGCVLHRSVTQLHLFLLARFLKFTEHIVDIMQWMCVCVVALAPHLTGLFSFLFFISFFLDSGNGMDFLDNCRESPGFVSF